MNEKIPVRVIALTVVLFTAASPSPGHTQQSQTSPSACYVPGSGTIYLIKQGDTPATCRAGHVEFRLAPAAATGPMAAMGGQNGGNALPTNTQGAVDLSNVDGLVAAGTWGTGNIPATGAGTRLMWYPGKAALRAGIVSGNQWDDATVGSSSAAFGANTTASGVWSLAAGTNSFATGMGSFAMGYQSMASGNYSVAMGYQAKASNYASISMGDQTKAEGHSSVALGHQAKTTGNFSAALGHWALAGDQYAVAIGNSTATGSNSIAIGGTASGNSAIAIGSSATASGSSAIVIGRHSDASGLRSMALGTRASTNGKTGAFVFGDDSYNGWAKAQMDNHFVVRAKKFWLGHNDAVTATANRFIETSVGAYLSSGGAWVSSSDSTKKHGWKAVDGEDVLSRLSAMPVRSWSYREEVDSVRHLGPTAQDFRTAFGLGDTDKAIATVDADGVSLAGIKALIQRTADLRRENEELRALLDDVTRRLTELETGGSRRASIQPDSGR
jgi:hypothetical protein